MFSSWPDLSEWATLDRRVETYSKLWARVKFCQAGQFFFKKGEGYRVPVIRHPFKRGLQGLPKGFNIGAFKLRTLPGGVEGLGLRG